jgi:prepilin-type N-terminal cleavage/methylation domain-containing protein
MNRQFLHKSTNSNHRGFSMTEVLVSILVLSLFTLSATSLMVYAAQNRVSARSDGEVTDGLQLLTENLRDRAVALPASTSACSATAVANGYGKLLADSILADTSTITLNGRDYIANRILADTSTITLNDRTYDITPTLTPVNVAPFDRLQVTYTLTSQTRTSDTITMTTEIIPNVAFQCP